MTRPLALTVSEVAAALRVSKNTIYRAIAEDDIPTVPNLGRVVRIPAAWLDETLRARVSS